MFSTAFSTILTLTLLLIAGRADAAIVKKDVEYNLAGRPYVGYVAYDDALKGDVPGVLVAHAWMGIDDDTKAKVERMAGLGYVAFAVDIYGKGKTPQNAKEAGELSGAFKKDRVMLRAHMQQGLSMLTKQAHVDKKRLAVVGYCFGGTAAIELARAGADVKAVVSFHGGLDSPRPEDGKRIKGHVLAMQGADDPFVPAKDIAAFEDEMRKAGVDYQFVQYGGAVHSFTDKGAGSDNSKGTAYNASADKRSWQAMQDFFKEVL